MSHTNEPAALMHANWLSSSLTIGAPEAAEELRRLHEVEKHRDELLSDIERMRIRLEHADAQSEQLAEMMGVFGLVMDELGKRHCHGGNAPGHGHTIPGVWDSDNGELAGKPCAWCAVYNKAKELLSRQPHGQPEKKPETSAPAIVFFPAGSLGEEVTG